jgi:hypothetical protein
MVPRKTVRGVGAYSAGLAPHFFVPAYRCGIYNVSAPEIRGGKKVENPGKRQEKAAKKAARKEKVVHHIYISVHEKRYSYREKCIFFVNERKSKRGFI